MAMCFSSRCEGIELAERMATGLSEKLLSSATRAAAAGKFSSWLAMVVQNFSCTQKTPVIALSLAGRFQNKGLETLPEPAGVPRLMRRTK